jgi:NADPH-dependent glutamate synthase beta chain and related oxidoreductases
MTDQGVQAAANGRLLVSGDGRLPYQTHQPKVFAGGDAVRGADLVVTAVAEGRDAAASITAWLAQQVARSAA